MINKIINAVSLKLSKMGEYTVYVEDVTQGFNAPCFFIVNLRNNHTAFLGKRSKRVLSLDVHYFPMEGKHQNKDINAMADRLLLELEFITLEEGSMIRGWDMSTESVDTVLHFFVNYAVFVNKVQENKICMGDLNYRGGL